MITNGRVSRGLTATLFALALAIPAAAESRDTNVPVASNVHSFAAAIHIDNFGKVNANYYRGAQPQGHDYADLAGVGIKTVIDFTEDGDASEASIVKDLGMTFYRIPMNTHRVPTKEQLTQFLKIVNDPASQPVYVHCQGGRHRTGVMTAVYRMTNDSWTADKAFAEMKQYKYGADFLHTEFKQFVYDYKSLPAASDKTVVALGVRP
jgi:protein tyrosine/serine phosphatase